MTEIPSTKVKLVTGISGKAGIFVNGVKVGRLGGGRWRDNSGRVYTNFRLDLLDGRSIDIGYSYVDDIRRDMIDILKQHGVI